MAGTILGLLVTTAVCLGLMASCITGYNLAVVKSGSQEVQFASLDVDGQEIIGLARLRGRLFVVCVMNSSLFVFHDTYPYARIAVISISDLAGMGPGDMVVNQFTKNLYIIDWRAASDGGTRVWKVNPGTLDVEYFANATGWTGTLAAVGIGCVLGVSGNARVNTACPRQDIVRLALPNGTVDPQHAVLGRDTSFYVTVGWMSGQPHRVLNVNRFGRLKHEYGDAQPGNGTGQFFWPRYVLVTPPGDVLVADFCNRRIVQLTASLTSPTVLLSSTTHTEFGWPQRMMLVPDDRIRDRFDVFVAMAETAPPSWFCQ
jgi:hypothetical protein